MSKYEEVIALKFYSYFLYVLVIFNFFHRYLLTKLINPTLID